MAQFPPNLDDGDLYLPSDIFLNQKIPTRFNPNHRNLSYMDDLAHHFTALSLLRQTLPNPPLKIPYNSQRLMRPPLRTHVVNPLRPPNYYARHGSLQLEVAHSPFSAPIPTPTSSERVVQWQQLNRLVQQNRVLSNQGNGFGFRGGLRRESGGTGVFHPHPRINTTDAKKKQSLRDREELQKNEQRNSIKRVGVSKRNDCYYHLPPDMGLPRDWTY
ncbi:hypothetical protein Ddye_008456 [Dipteronia dyeriana]|uniref:Uncharacterized protein n=1 Tax=Dipteronia dyeriana TaxID=168575 RepID=A0AAE0CLD7_9ROSI|nr:hypothetical protein Ddye_008456 [Dipteronia dyeriana]